MATSFANDVLPKFRPGDIGCMTPRGINIGDAPWMCDATPSHGFDDHGNARYVYQALSNGIMPPDGAWPPDWLETFQNWMTDGFQP